MAGYLNLQPYSFRDGRDFLPASLLFALHATLSLFALHGMNIPMYGAIKRCTPLVSLILSVVVLRKAIPSKHIVVSILLMTGGCLVASIGDLEFDKHAYAFGLLSVFAQVPLKEKAQLTDKLEIDR
jgi:solute carrier family 35 protein